MNTLGSGSSGRSAAIIGHAFQSERCLSLTRLSFDALMRFEQGLGTTPDYKPIGCLLIAGPASAGELCRRHALLQRIGVESNLVDRDAIDRLTPGLNLMGIDLGLHVLRDGEIDPYSIMMGFAGYARRMRTSNGRPHHRRIDQHRVRGQCGRLSCSTGRPLGRYGPTHCQPETPPPRYRAGGRLRPDHPLHR